MLYLVIACAVVGWGFALGLIYRAATGAKVTFGDNVVALCCVVALLAQMSLLPGLFGFNYALHKFLIYPNIWTMYVMLAETLLAIGVGALIEASGSQQLQKRR